MSKLSERGTLTLLILLIIFLSLFCGPTGTGITPKKGYPNVILIVIDTLRADHLGCYGYHRNTSPQIDKFANAATLYRKSYSSSPWTVPSHASMFTGKDALEHGARTFFVSDPEPQIFVNPLARAHVTIAEILLKEGYTTGAFIANFAFLTRHFQFNQGFTTFHVKYDYAAKMNPGLFNWIENMQDDSFFLFINYMDTHKPYNITPRPGFIDDVDSTPNEVLFEAMYEAVLPGEKPVAGDLARKIIDQYDVAIANMDEQIGVLIEFLKSLDLFEETLLIITSDHGEYFGEHQLVEHSKDVYQEALHVPLIVKSPHQKVGAENDTLVSSVDIPQIIIENCLLEKSGNFTEIFPYSPGNHMVVSENYYGRNKDFFDPRWGHRFQRIRRAFFDWPHKFIFSSDDKHELYNIHTDKKEAENLIAVNPEIAAVFDAKIQRFLRETQQEQQLIEKPLSRKQEEALRSLGYIK